MDETDLEDDELGMKASDILARSAANPYNEKLAGMLDKYLGQQQEVTRKKKEILDAATKKLLDRGKPTAMDQAAELFRISAAFGKPTRTGAFGETLANVGETAAGILEKRGKTSDEMRDLLLKYQLQGLDLDTEASKTQLEALTALTKAAGTKKETTSETERLAKIVNDPNVPKDQREIARRRLDKLTYIKPESGTGVGGQAQSSAGKTAADMGFRPGTPEFNRKVEELTKTGEGARLTPRAETELFEAQDKIAAGKDVIRQFERALKLNDVAYAGRTSGLRESIGSVIPIVSESDAQTATAELENIVLSAALGQLKAIFGAAPTEGERKILIDVQGSINKPKETRKRIWEAAQKAAARRIKSNEEKIKNIQSGAYMRQSESEPENFAIGGPVLQAAGNYAKRSGLATPSIPTSGVPTAGLNELSIAGPTGAPVQKRPEWSPTKFYLTATEAENVNRYKELMRTRPAQADTYQRLIDDILERATPRLYDTNQTYFDRYIAAINQYDKWKDYIQEREEYFRERERRPNNTKDYSADRDRLYQVLDQRYDRIGQVVDDWSERMDRYGARLPNQVFSGRSKANMQTARDLAAAGEPIDWAISYGKPAPYKDDPSLLTPATQFVAQPKVPMATAPRTNVAQYGQNLPAPVTPASVGFGLQDQPIPMKDGGLSLANIGRAGAQGLGFGWGDEAIARVRAKMEGRPYEEVLAEERLALEQFGKKYPLTALTSEIAGAALPTAAAVLMPGGQPAAAANVARYGTQMARMLPKALRGQTGRMAGLGGGAGVVAGAGTATEGNRLSGAIEGGLTGAVAGPIVGKATDLAGTMGKNLYDRVRRGPMSVDEKAERKVLEAMSRDEMDLDEMRARMQTDRDLGVNSMLMDVSPSMQTLGEATVTMPGSGRKTLGGPLAERLEEGRERVAERAFRDVGKGVDFTEQEASLVGRLRANASNMYENAYAKGSVNDPRIMRVLEDDTFKKAYDEARDIARVEAKAAELRGEDPSKFALEKIYEVDGDGNIVKVNIPDVRTLDYIKRGIDSLIDKGYKGAGMSTAQATALKDLKKEFVKVIDENVPEYAAARAQYKGDIEVLDALRFGNEKFLKTVPNQAQKMIADMSVAEKDALRAGVAQSILSKVLDSPRQENAAQKIIGSPNTQKRLRMLFDNQAEYEIFEAALTREADMFRSAQEILRNSRTANKKEAIEDLKKSTSRIFDIAGEAIEVSTGNPGSIIGKTLRYLQARATLDEATAGRIAQILKSGTEDEVNTVLQRLERQAGKFGAEQQTRLGRQESASRIAGTVLPQPESLAMPPAEEEPEEDVDALVERLLSGENQ